MSKILVWDLPVRLGHWLMAVGFAVAWLTGESEELRLVHACAGGTVAAVALFRILWGLIGTRHARFADFLRGPVAAIAYLKSLLGGKPQHYTGHNPAGGYAVVLLLALALAAAAAGWLNYQEIGGDAMEELHDGLTATMLAVVVVHLAGVLTGSLKHRENLPRAMLTGRKEGAPEEAIIGTRPLAAVVLLAWVAAAVWFLAR